MRLADLSRRSIRSGTVRRRFTMQPDGGKLPLIRSVTEQQSPTMLLVKRWGYKTLVVVIGQLYMTSLAARRARSIPSTIGLQTTTTLEAVYLPSPTLLATPLPMCT